MNEHDLMWDEGCSMRGWKVANAATCMYGCTKTMALIKGGMNR